MKFINPMAVLLSLTLAFSALAHISLKQSTPVSDAILMQSPDQLALTFSGKVRLAKVKLTNASDQAVNFDFTPSSALNTQFDWPLPSLAEGMYKVDWVALGEDGHKMSGEFSFMVHVGEEHSVNMINEKPSSHTH